MVERAEKVASGERPLKKDRFVTFTDTSTSVNWDLVERARSLAGTVISTALSHFRW